ncbi:MAG: hypothetical protein M3348_12925, partial [Acidobacteriota bacterium]|nr:hypothetical protein [Acidobacteriota bacterium]
MATRTHKQTARRVHLHAYARLGDRGRAHLVTGMRHVQVLAGEPPRGRPGAAQHRGFAEWAADGR